MRSSLFVLALLVACGGPNPQTVPDGGATQSDCSQWKDAITCAAHSGCLLNGCPDCSGTFQFIDCIGEGGPGVECPAKWLNGCCRSLTTDAACKGLAGCYSVFGSTSQFEACYGGQPVCTTTQACANGISCPSGYSPTSGSNYPGGDPTTDAGTGCGCVESSSCTPDL